MDKKDMNEFLKASTDQSMMRLMSIRTVNTALFIAITTCLAGSIGFVYGVVKGTGMELLGTAIGGLAGLSGALVGTLLISAFGGKAAQSFSEQSKTPDNSQSVSTATSIDNTTK